MMMMMTNSDYDNNNNSLKKQTYAAVGKPVGPIDTKYMLPSAADTNGTRPTNTRQKHEAKNTRRVNKTLKGVHQSMTFVSL